MPDVMTESMEFLRNDIVPLVRLTCTSRVLKQHVEMCSRFRDEKQLEDSAPDNAAEAVRGV